jgi:hypothetical protein
MKSLTPNTFSSDYGTNLPGKSRRKFYIALAFCAGLIVLGLMALQVLRFKAETEQVMTALNIYTDTLIQRDYESACQITSPAFREAIDHPAFVMEQTKLKNSAP